MSEPIDLSSPKNPLELLADARNLNAKRMQQLAQVGVDASFPVMLNRINFILDQILGPVDTSEDRMKLELVWETQVMANLLTDIESHVRRAQLAAGVNQMPPTDPRLN